MEKGKDMFSRKRGGKQPLKKISPGILAAVLLLAGLVFIDLYIVYPIYPSTGPGIKIIPLYIGSEKFMVEVADTPEKHLRGMMFREFIPGDFGMLFINDREAPRSFWMKNCKVSLDIIFLDRNKKVINMHINVPPCYDEPCKTYESERPALYILELRGNRATELNLKPGDTIFFILN